MTDVTPTNAMVPPPKADVSAPAPAPANVEGQQGAPSAAPPGGVQGNEQTSPNQTPKWVQARIDELTKARREAERQRDAERAETARLRALVAPGEQQGAPSARAPAPANEADVEERVTQRLRAENAEAQFANKCNEVYQQAITVDPEFGNSYRQMVTDLGAPPRQFLEQVIDQPDAAAVLKHFSSNYDDAARIFALPPLAQGRELERLSAKLASTPKPPVISSAPAPTRQVDGGGTELSRDYEKMSIDEFMRQRNTQHRRRS